MSMAAELDNVEAWSGKDRGDENFPVGSQLIRRDLRAHVHAYYAFARNADDIADSPVLSAEDKIARLDHMEAVLLGHAETGAPSARALRDSLRITDVAPRHATDLLIAFRRDATKTRYADWAELYDYCRYSAMPVGRYVLDLHGEDAATHGPSDALCAALQVLNHLQDCGKDLAALDRCYLPQDWMAAFGASMADLAAPRCSPGLRNVLDAALAETFALCVEAEALPRGVRARGLRLETAIIVGLAHRLHRRLARRDPLGGRVKLMKTDILGAVLAALRHL